MMVAEFEPVLAGGHIPNTNVSVLAAGGANRAVFVEGDAVDWTTLQAVAPTAELLGDLRRIAGQSTKIVWITSQKSPPVPAEHLVLPASEAEAWIFRLDQS